MGKHKVDLSTTDNDSQLLLKLHEQFSENQNHHQGLFIKILIALFALFGAFGYVLINAEGVKLLEKPTDSYPHITLVLVAILVSGVLLFLNLFVLNNGYAYRRDQYINQKIREKFLGDEYTEIFGGNYKADNKCLNDYLPSFYNLFFGLIIIGQIFILFIIIYYVQDRALGKNVLILLSVSSLFFYFSTYYKYIKNIKLKKEENFIEKLLPFLKAISFSIISISFIISSICSDRTNFGQIWEDILQNNAFDPCILMGFLMAIVIGFAIAIAIGLTIAWFKICCCKRDD